MQESTKRKIAGTAIALTMLSGGAFVEDRVITNEVSGRQLKGEFTDKEWRELVPQVRDLVDKEDLSLNEIFIIEDVINKQCEGGSINNFQDLSKEDIKNLVLGNCNI